MIPGLPRPAAVTFGSRSEALASRAAGSFGAALVVGIQEVVCRTGGRRTRTAFLGPGLTDPAAVAGTGHRARLTRRARRSGHTLIGPRADHQEQRAALRPARAAFIAGVESLPRPAAVNAVWGSRSPIVARLKRAFVRTLCETVGAASRRPRADPTKGLPRPAAVTPLQGDLAARAAEWTRRNQGLQVRALGRVAGLAGDLGGRGGHSAQHNPADGKTQKKLSVHGILG